MKSISIFESKVVYYIIFQVLSLGSLKFYI